VSRLPSKPLASQSVMDLETDEDRARAAEEERRERTRQHTLKIELWSAMEAATVAMGGTKVVAGRLDDLWGNVSDSKYRACLEGANYNKPSIEWLFELALDPRVANVLRAIADGKTELSAEEERDNWREIARERFPKDAASLEREATTRRKRRAR
jgi:hypothetical protein